MRCFGYLSVKKTYKINLNETELNRTKENKRICFLLSVSFVFGSKVYSFPESLIAVLIPFNKITQSASTTKVVNKQMTSFGILTRKNCV